MKKDKPIIKTENAHFLKGHASWLYCDNCNKTVAYLCYVTYSYFLFSFECSCGSHGKVENSYCEVDGTNKIDLENLKTGALINNSSNKRFCCANDDSALFSAVSKNLKSYSGEIVCKECDTKYVFKYSEN